MCSDNEIEVGDKTTLKEYSQDLWINTQVKGVAAKTLGLRALSFNFETIKGKVYIAGITSRKEQLEELKKEGKKQKGLFLSKKLRQSAKGKRTKNLLFIIIGLFLLSYLLLT